MLQASEKSGHQYQSALLSSPISLFAIAAGIAVFLRAVFYHFASRIWAMDSPVRPEEITSWSRQWVLERDGAETSVLLLLVLTLIGLTILARSIVELHPVLGRRLVWVALLVSGISLLTQPPSLPMTALDSVWWQVLGAEIAVCLAAGAAWWVSTKKGALLCFAIALIPVCFVASTPPSHSDLECILAPALQLRLGVPVTQIYFLYDFLLPSIAVVWHWIGADPYAFSFCTKVAYYLLLLGCFVLGRQMFAERRLAGLLVIALCIIRIYANGWDANAMPQATAARLDLWILVLFPAWLFGLRHWTVGLAAGLLMFFSRTFGILYLGAYGLALATDFLVRRASREQSVSFARGIAAEIRQMLPAFLWIAAGILGVRLIFGAIVSDAVLMYRRLGLTMLRIAADSLYWWLAPMLAAVVCLAISLRREIGEKKFGATLFAVALAVANSVYFFGHSHENNLINVSAALVFCAFLGMDLALLSARHDRPQLRWILTALPFVMLAFVTYFYCGSLLMKIRIQATTVFRGTPQRPYDNPGPIDCREINAVAHDPKVFVYSEFDFWYYDKCGYVPQGYVQPLLLQPLRAKLIDQLGTLLDSGYKIVVPKLQGNYNFDFRENEALLPGLEKVESANYWIYRRKASTQPPAGP